MRIIVAICLFFSSLFAVAQADSISLKEAMIKLDKALLEKNYSTLQSVLHKDVSYGHSNGWVENKTDISNDLKTGKLVYNKIENSEMKIVSMGKKWATVRTNTEAAGSVNGTAFQLKLHVLQVWMNTKRGWQLLARQSTKL
jgi:hypothetical protein